MKITCHSCAAKYTVSDEKVQGKTVKMKCRKCGATIVVGAASHGDGGDDAAHAGDAATEAPPPGSFLVSVSDQDQRTMSLAEVVEAYNSGVITAETYVFADGMSDWQALAENESIVAALNEAAGAVSGASFGSAPAAEPAPASGGYDNGGYDQGGYAPAASPYAAAATPYAAPQPSYSAPQAAAAPIATESKPQAARRDAGRKSADLFGGGLGAEPAAASYSSSNALAASSSLSNTTGKRDENSVLFSLNALTGGAPPAARPSATTATKEDSGLIDLKALSANASATQAAPAPVDMGLFPLGAPVAAPPPQQQLGYAGPAIQEPKKSSKIGLVIGGVVAVAAVVGVFLLVKGGGEDKANASNAATNTPSVTASATVAAGPTTPASASSQLAAGTESVDETGSAAGSHSVASAGPPTRYTGGPRPRTTKTDGPATGGPKPPPPDAPKALPCGCKPGDVDCAIKCSMKKK